MVTESIFPETACNQLSTKQTQAQASIIFLIDLGRRDNVVFPPCPSMLNVHQKDRVQ